MTPDVMRAAEVLMRHGEYDESADSVAWLRMEATQVAYAATADVVVAILADTAWFDPTQETDARARRVADEVMP